MYAHWNNQTHTKKAVFEAYFRKLPFGNGYAVFAGLERIVDYIKSLRFTKEEVDYLAKQKEQYAPAFLDQLLHFSFRGTLYSMKEGAIVFPDEPLIRVEGTIMETQFVETALLNFMNYQTLIATKASRIKQVAGTDALFEFGSRRAHEEDAAIWGARASYIAGFDATSNVLAGYRFDIPTVGTHAHSWVQSFSNESEAFDVYAQSFPDQVTLLVDTFDPLTSGVPHAIQTAKKMEARGAKMKAVRLDSGDLAYLSIRTRHMLDEAGLHDVQIIASNNLDEHTIFNLKAQGAKINSWGVGTKLITAADQPSLGGVYKLVEREIHGSMMPTIKISANQEKISSPGKKNIFRIVDRKRQKAISDYVCLTTEEQPGPDKPLKLFHPLYPYLNKTVLHYEAIPLLQPIFINGEQVYDLPPLKKVREYHQQQLALFWPEYLRKLNPEFYRVNMSLALWQLKQKLMTEHLDQMNNENK